jgi:hypothetical protein
MPEAPALQGMVGIKIQPQRRKDECLMQDARIITIDVWSDFN